MSYNGNTMGLKITKTGFSGLQFIVCAPDMHRAARTEDNGSYSR